MKPRTYATRFLLIMTGILGFAAAQGPIYAGTLLDCLDILETAKDCYKCPNTGDLKTVTVQAFPGHDVQCDIKREPGNATLTLLAQTTGPIGPPTIARQALLGRYHRIRGLPRFPPPRRQTFHGPIT